MRVENITKQQRNTIFNKWVKEKYKIEKKNLEKIIKNNYNVFLLKKNN